MERFTSLDSLEGKAGKDRVYRPPRSPLDPFTPSQFFFHPSSRIRILFTGYHRPALGISETQYNTTTLFICRFTSRLIGAYLLATSKPVNRGTPSSFTTVKSSPSHWRQDGCASLIFFLVGVENPKICLISFAQITVLSQGERLTDDQ